MLYPFLWKLSPVYLCPGADRTKGTCEGLERVGALMIRPFMRGRFASVGIYALVLYGVLYCKQSLMSMVSPASVQD